MAQCRLVSVTRGMNGEDPEQIIAYCARVSNPKNQNNPQFARLFKTMIREEHWSPFEMVSMCIEIKTTIAISRQIIRHRSFCFQEFSQRYANVTDMPQIQEARRQDFQNRQNSIADLPEEIQSWWAVECDELFERSMSLYQAACDRGIAKECARFVLPMAAPTTIMMSGTVRSWIHFLKLRSAHGTQKEHMDIARECRDIFVREFPILSEALEWTPE